MWAPGRIPAGTSSNELISTMDLLPTIASLTKSELPEGRKIDGLDLSTTVTGYAPSKRTEFIYYTAQGQVNGIRVGEWKLLLEGKGKKEQGPYLFNLATEISESTNLADKHPEKVNELKSRLEELDTEIEKNARSIWKKN
jgi:arylsulfatase A-like enzyme